MQYAKTNDPVFAAWIEAARMTGLPVTDDYNGRSGEGFGRSQYSIRDGKRCSAAVGYLRPAMKRKNLTSRSRAQVDAHRHGRQARDRRRIREGRE